MVACIPAPQIGILACVLFFWYLFSTLCNFDFNPSSTLFFVFFCLSCSLPVRCHTSSGGPAVFKCFRMGKCQDGYEKSPRSFNHGCCCVCYLISVADRPLEPKRKRKKNLGFRWHVLFTSVVDVWVHIESYEKWKRLIWTFAKGDGTWYTNQPNLFLNSLSIYIELYIYIYMLASQITNQTPEGGFLREEEMNKCGLQRPCRSGKMNNRNSPVSDR